MSSKSSRDSEASVSEYLEYLKKCSLLFIAVTHEPAMSARTRISDVFQQIVAKSFHNKL